MSLKTKEMKKFAIILSGCGVYDGTEIHESTLSMLSICQLGHSYQLFAPNILQHHVVNHATGNISTSEQRNVLTEAARIARGNILDIRLFDPTAYDILLFPGGFGITKNLCDFAFKGENYQVIPEVQNVIHSMHQAQKPIGAMCIAPILLAAVLKKTVITLGVACDASLAVEKLGAKHVVTSHEEVVIDKENKLATTPCYMLEANIAQIAQGANNIIKSLIEMC